MKKILLLSFLLPCLTDISAQVKCEQGNQNPPVVNDSIREPVSDLTSQGQLSYDPNEVIGPEGYDSVRWVSINDVLNYTILFENDPEFATAAAQKVDVRFDFQNKAWMKGFGIGGYSFSNMSFPVTKPSNAYQQRIDLKDSLGYYVDLIGGLDVAKQQGFWTFTTIDPETGYAPMQAERGLLPVNDSTHVGEGAVTFQLKPYEGLKTGDTISIAANIVFDTNDTIPTNRWTNKIDAGMPESKLTAETHPTLPNVYNLKFTGKDDEGGSGIRHLLLYLANHNGIYEEIDTVAVDSVLAFPVEAGKQYKLYSIAVDNTGNREPAKLQPDVILNFNQAPTDIALSDTIFQDDLAAGGYIGRLTSVDTEDNKTFTYALAEGDGAIHNDLFQITDDQLQIKNSFKCAEDSIYKVRISTTDEGGMSFSKPFVLQLVKVLEKPKADTLTVTICEGETCLFHGVEYDKTGLYTYSQSNEYMCDSVFVLNLTVAEILDAPTVTVDGVATLVSSAQKGNQWFREDGTPVEGATEPKFTPMEDGIYYVAASNGSCFSAPSQKYRVQLDDQLDLILDLAQGWNWISSPLDGAEMQNAKKFLAPIQEQTSQLVGTEGTLDADGWQGTLTTINPKSSYKLQMDASVQHTWQGITVKPENNTINLQQGNTWLGYLLTAEKPLAEVLASMQPNEGDVIKTQDAFAVYLSGNWHGTLEQMKPGVGYMYSTTQAKQLTYPITRVFPVSNPSLMARRADATAPWSYDAHKYADNTTMLAKLQVDGSPAVEGAYTVAAFDGSECRGIGQYIDGIIYMTIHGTIDNAETLSFKAYENATGKELNITETIAMNGQHEGTISSPKVLNAATTTGIELITTGFTIYPRPLRSHLYINGETSNIKLVRMLSSGGAKVIESNGYNGNGINISNLGAGVYVVAIITNDNKVYYEKVLKVE